MYKTKWVNSKELWFSNADVWGEITYTILTSILAASFFYVFAEFIPKLVLLRKMKNELLLYINRIELILDDLTNTINNKRINTGEGEYEFKLEETDDTGEFNNDSLEQFREYFKISQIEIESIISSLYYSVDKVKNEVYTRYFNVLNEELKNGILSTFTIYDNFQTKDPNLDLFITFLDLCKLKTDVSEFKSILLDKWII